jgi:hypothetical protein
VVQGGFVLPCITILLLSTTYIILFTHNAGQGLRPDFLLWVRQALLLKGEEKKSAKEIADAIKEIMDKMTSTWNSKIYGACLYMFAYAVGGNMLQIFAIQ